MFMADIFPIVHFFQSVSLSSGLWNCCNPCPQKKNWLLLWAAMAVLCGNKQLTHYNVLKFFDSAYTSHNSFFFFLYFPLCFRSTAGQCEEAVRVYNSTPLQELSDLAGLALAYCRAGLITESTSGEGWHTY